jgi:eukaryotic-like serine/threonine-protein kinase
VIGSGALVDGRYRLESIIGAGGMGVVWAATHERLDRKVALKQIPLVVPGGEPAERIRARTLREARITASLNEVDGVVRIANYFDDEHNVWLELEYLDALNLAELIQATGGLPPAEVAWIGARVARALAGGHELEPPVQHREIKPGNVLVSRDGAAVKLSD